LRYLRRSQQSLLEERRIKRSATLTGEPNNHASIELLFLPLNEIDLSITSLYRLSIPQYVDKDRSALLGLFSILPRVQAFQYLIISISPKTTGLPDKEASLMNYPVYDQDLGKQPAAGVDIV
jgi:hypothetical protein